MVLEQLDIYWLKKINFHFNFKPKLLQVYQPSTFAYAIPLVLCQTLAITACQDPYPWRHNLKSLFFMKYFSITSTKSKLSSFTYRSPNMSYLCTSLM